MAIIFEPLAIAAGTSVTELVILVSLDARSEAITAGTSETDLVLLLSTDGGLDQIFASEPEIPTVADFSLYLSMDGELATDITSETELVLNLSMDGYLGNADDSFTELTLALNAESYMDLSFDNYAFLVQQPAVLVGLGDVWAVRLQDTVAFNLEQSQLPTYVLRDYLALQTPTIRNKYEDTIELRDVLILSEDLEYTLIKSILDSLVLNGAMVPTFTSYARVVERLILGGHVSGIAEAYVKILDAMVFNAVAEMLTRVTITDSLVLNGHVDAYYTLFAKILDTLVLQSALATDSLAVIVLRDTVLFNADLSHEADLTALIMDSVSFATTLSIDNGEYIAWVINTENTALSRYTNYPFNSFAKIGDSYVGAASDGLHTLDGDDDNGDAINARLRQGLSDMGSRKLKQIPEAYIGATVDGQLLMQVIIVDERTGTKKGATYKMANRGAVVNRENRIPFGKGLQSVDWDWVLENVDGADFDIGSIEFRPLYLARRTRG